MSALIHFHTEDWGTGQILGVFSSHFFFFCVQLPQWTLLSLLLKQLTKELGETHMSSLSLTLGHPSYFPLRCLKLLLGGNCWWGPITEIKARKAEAFISVTLASPALYKGSFSEDQEESLRNRFSLRKKELGGGGGGETWDGRRKVVVWQLLSKSENPWRSQKAERNSLEKVVLETTSMSIATCGPCNSIRGY